MDRQIVYAGGLPRSFDFAQMQQSVMVALGWLGQAVLGTAPASAGLAVTPTAPASMSVVVGAGMLSAYGIVESAPFGSALLADTNDTLLKFGINIAPTMLHFVAPITPGKSQNYLIYAEFEEEDGTPIVLPFVNQANTSAQWSGQGNNGQPLNTQRLQSIVVAALPGAPANVGSQTTPAVPNGAVPLAVLTLTYGQTSILAANIVIAPGNPAIPYTLPQIPTYFQLKLGYVPADSAGDKPGTLTFPGASPTVTVGAGGSGTLNANLLSSTALATGTATINGALNVTGSMGVTGPASITNSLAAGSVNDGTGNATLNLVGAGGGDVVVGFNSANNYGVKMGLKGGTGPLRGYFYVGGWSDGAGVYRMSVDPIGNMAVRGQVAAANFFTPGSINASGSINGSTVLATNGLFTQSSVKGADRPVHFRDETGAETASIISSGGNGVLYLSANAGNAYAMSLDPNGNFYSPGNVSAGATLSGANVYASSGITAGNNVTAANQIIAQGGQIAAVGGGGTITFGGAAGSAGQASYRGNAMQLYSGLGCLYVLPSGQVQTSYNNTTLGTVALSPPSARALKENAAPLEGSLAVVRGLQALTYDYTEASGLSHTGPQHGFYAEDVADALPFAHLLVEERQGVALHKMIPTLWRAVQELDAANGELRAQVAALAARLPGIDGARPN